MRAHSSPRWAALALLAALASPALVAQEPPQPADSLDVVFPGWRVYDAASDSTVSTHQTYHVALERASNYAIRSGRLAYVGLVGPVRVRWIASASPPPPPDTPPTPDTTPAPPPPDTVTTPPPGGGSSTTVSQSIDWSDYASADAFFARATKVNPPDGTYEIRTVVPPAGATWTRAMRMTFLAARSHSDMGVGFRDYPIAGRPREVWIEFWVRFSPGFTTSGPESGGTDWKFLFLFDQEHSGSWRWAHHIGVFGPDIQLRLKGATTVSPTARDVFDGQWHRFRYHARMDAPGRWGWGLDARPIEYLSATNLDRGSGYYFHDFSIGRTFNRGVSRDQWYELGPVRVWTTQPGW